MALTTGDKLPEFKFPMPSDEGPAAITTQELCAGKTVVIFGVPGAFTPTCHANHMAGYVEHFDDILEAGADSVAVISVNDVFVMDAWREASKAAGKIVFLADGSAEFVRKAGLDLDMSGFGFGTRSKRFSMIVKDGEITHLNIEESPGQVDMTGAATAIKQLKG